MTYSRFISFFTIVRLSLFMDIRVYFSTVQELLNKVPFAAVDEVVEALISANRAGQTVFICGNGGSALTATHFGYATLQSAHCCWDNRVTVSFR